MSPTFDTVFPLRDSLASPDGFLTTQAESVLDGLLTRTSSWPLTDPAPTDAQLDMIFDVALRAPDHGRLRPWRFVLIRDDARAALGEILVNLACARTPGSARSEHEHRRRKAFAAPVIIALGAAITQHTKVPESEQLLSVGAATMNMLNAIHALGYGGFWATGPDSYEPAMLEALGYAPHDKLVGFLFVGTPATPGIAPERPTRQEHVREWSPTLDGDHSSDQSAAV